MEARGRGRGLGRARGLNQAGAAGAQQRPGQAPQQQPRAQPAQAQPGAAAPGGAGAWVRPSLPQTPAWPRPQMTAAAPMGRGRTHEQEGPTATIQGAVAGGGDAPSKGSVRGRVINRREIVFTKPEHVTSKVGKSGAVVQLSANYIPLIKHEKWCLFQYRVDLSPDVDNTGQRKMLLRTATKDLLKGGYLFDGTVLFTPQRISPDPVELFVQTEAGENIRITIRHVGDLSWGDPHYLQLYNIIIRNCLRLMGMQQVGRNYYLPDAKITVAEHKIQLWPGFFTSMRQHEYSILMNVDLQFKFMRTDNCYDMLTECQSANIKREFTDAIVGSVVLTYYNNKTYRIDDVEWESTPQSTFEKRDGSKMSFADYYYQRYQVRIRHPDQPLLISRPSKREIRAGQAETIKLIPELCLLTGLTDRQRENFNLMRALANHTRIGPEGRIKKLMEFSNKIHRTPDVVKEIKRWDLNFATDLVKFQGRVLSNEIILSGGTAKYPAGPQADWTRELRNKKMFIEGRNNKLAVIYPARFKAQTNEFVKCLKQAAGGMGWRDLDSCKLFEIPDDRANTYIQQIEHLTTSVMPTMFLVVLSSNSQDRYSAIKKKCCVDKGIPTQMIVARNLTSKGVMSIATKVAIQMNCKVGGAPWSIANPLTTLMVIGYDVCRDTANKRKSFAGIVASMNRTLTHYYSAAFEHEAEEELSDNFGAFVVLACKQYKIVNNNYPERILIYRDGVGEGQIPYVKDHEIANIKKKLIENIYKNNDLKLAFVVVSKRINTRIFKGNQNPDPGTVVDDVITLPERYDFFIVSQCVRQGTVSPTSYNVIEDNMGLTPDQMQILTYKMTHMYYNWSGTVRVPAPCQYAHKLAFLVSQNLHRPAHPDLSKVLYYL